MKEAFSYDQIRPDISAMYTLDLLSVVEKAQKVLQETPCNTGFVAEVDICDFGLMENKKLKEFENELGISHQELELPWN